MSKGIYDVVIIGAGPSGMNTALYTSRSNLKTLILEQGMYGGQLNNTGEIENYIGLEKITGMELATNMFNQITKFNTEYAYGSVLNIKKENNLFYIKTDVEEYTSKTVVIATGTEHKKLGVSGELDYNGRGVSYCAICDGAFFQDKDIFVIGGGDSALEEGEYLTQYGSKVTLVHRRNELRGTEILQDRFVEKETSELLLNSNLVEIKGNGKNVTSIIINKDGETNEYKADGVFIYVGLSPNTDRFIDLDILDNHGYIVTNDKMETTIKGLFSVGDVRKKDLRQISTAIGDGAICGTEIYKYIKSL